MLNVTMQGVFCGSTLIFSSWKMAAVEVIHPIYIDYGLGLIAASVKSFFSKCFVSSS